MKFEREGHLTTSTYIVEYNSLYSFTWNPESCLVLAGGHPLLQTYDVLDIQNILFHISPGRYAPSAFVRPTGSPGVSSIPTEGSLPGPTHRVRRSTFMPEAKPRCS